MFRKKNGQEFMDERNVDSSVNDKEEKKGFFHRRKKKEINLYEDDMGYMSYRKMRNRKREREDFGIGRKKIHRKKLRQKI